MFSPVCTPLIAGLLLAQQAFAQDTLAPPWHQVVRAYHLTTDATPDTLSLQVWKNRPSDTLRVTLVIRGIGTELFRDSWIETYYGGEPMDPSMTLERWLAAMRATFDSFFDDSHFFTPSNYRPPENLVRGHDCSDPDPRGCIAWYAAYDAVLARWKRLGRTPGKDVQSFYRALYDDIDAEPVDAADVNATWQDILAHTPAVFSMSYGYEATIRIAWSTRKHAFVKLFECC